MPQLEKAYVQQRWPSAAKKIKTRKIMSTLVDFSLLEIPKMLNFLHMSTQSFSFTRSEHLELKGLQFLKVLGRERRKMFQFYPQV